MIETSLRGLEDSEVMMFVAAPQKTGPKSALDVYDVIGCGETEYVTEEGSHALSVRARHHDVLEPRQPLRRPGGGQRRLAGGHAEDVVVSVGVLDGNRPGVEQVGGVCGLGDPG